MGVQEIYQQLVSQGKPPKDAAREAQERTGYSLVTGRPIRRDPNLTKKALIGQYK